MNFIRWKPWLCIRNVLPFCTYIFCTEYCVFSAADFVCWSPNGSHYAVVFTNKVDVYRVEVQIFKKKKLFSWKIVQIDLKKNKDCVLDMMQFHPYWILKVSRFVHRLTCKIQVLCICNNMFFRSAGCRSVRKNEKKYDNIIPKSKQICHCVVELSVHFFSISISDCHHMLIIDSWEENKLLYLSKCKVFCIYKCLKILNKVMIHLTLYQSD